MLLKWKVFSVYIIGYEASLIDHGGFSLLLLLYNK